MAFLSRINEYEKYIKIFDIKQNDFCRRLDFNVMDDEAFCINSKASVVVKVEGD